MRVTKQQLQERLDVAMRFAALPFIVLTSKQWEEILQSRANIVVTSQYGYGYASRDGEVGTDFSYRYFVSDGPTAVAGPARRRGSPAGRS